MASHFAHSSNPRDMGRRRFVQAAALAAASLPFRTFANQAVGRADLVVEGGTFVPMDPALAEVEAMADQSGATVSSRSDAHRTSRPSSAQTLAESMPEIWLYPNFPTNEMR